MSYATKPSRPVTAVDRPQLAMPHPALPVYTGTAAVNRLLAAA